jgi:hypothetical protein
MKNRNQSGVMTDAQWDKIKDVVTAVAIGITGAVMLVLWWTNPNM